jgi:zinc D-Ala-D-Ala dipeptidase
VIPDEWWHFDYMDWTLYPIINVRFEDLGQQQAGPVNEQ